MQSPGERMPRLWTRRAIYLNYPSKRHRGRVVPLDSSHCFCNIFAGIAGYRHNSMTKDFNHICFGGAHGVKGFLGLPPFNPLVCAALGRTVQCAASAASTGLRGRPFDFAPLARDAFAFADDLQWPSIRPMFISSLQWGHFIKRLQELRFQSGIQSLPVRALALGLWPVYTLARLALCGSKHHALGRAQ